VRRRGHGRVRLIPDALVDDRGVLAWIRDALVYRLAEIHPMGQHLVDGTLGPRLAAAGTGGATAPLRWRIRAYDPCSSRLYMTEDSLGMGAEL
jgi:hypothetical protein